MCDAHGRKPGGRFLEYDVHFFEAAARGFGVEEVDDRDDAGVSGREVGFSVGGIRRLGRERVGKEEGRGRKERGGKVDGYVRI